MRNEPPKRALWWQKKNDGRSVKTYEIRVLVEHPSSPAIYSSSHINDHAAIRRAITLAKPGQAIEVWCGARCIYAGLPTPHMVH